MIIINNIITRHKQILLMQLSSITPTILSGRQLLPGDQSIGCFIRTNFNISSKSIKQLPFNQYFQKLKSQSIIIISQLDSNFFQQLSYRVEQQQSKLKKFLLTNQIENCIKLIQAKIVLFQNLSLYFFQKFNQIHNKQYKQQESKQHIKWKDSLCQFLIPNTMKFLELYYKKTNRIEKLKISKTFINQIRVSFDNALDQYIKNYIDSLFPIKNSTFKKNQTIITSSDQKITQFDYKATCKQFLQRICLKFRSLYQQLLLLQTPTTQKDSKITRDSSNIYNQKSSTTNQYFKNNDSQSILQNIQIQQFIQSHCINCAQFLYKDLPFQNQRNSLVDFSLIKSVKSIKQQSEKILQSITAFLNKGSGTLLFDCKQTSFGFIPIGQKMYLKQQEGYKHSFENLLKYIKPDFSKKYIQHQIDFIPLKQNPNKAEAKIIANVQHPYVQRKFIQQTYVMRVKIRSKRQQQIYGCQIDKKLYFYVRKKGKTEQMHQNDIYELMQLKSYHYFSINNNKQIKKLQKHFSQQMILKFIKGRRQLLTNNHQGSCKQTLTLTSHR